METSNDVNTLRGEIFPPYIGITPNVSPEANSSLIADESSQTGVSTRSAPLPNENTDNLPILHKKQSEKHWYALRATYGREKQAHDYINSNDGTAFLPTMFIEKVVEGQKKLVEVSRLPNIFFAYGTEEKIKGFVYDNASLSYLRFYYKHTHVGAKIRREPLIVPDIQIETLRLICNSESRNEALLLAEEVNKFKTGEKVRVIEGNFKGVEGIIARYQGQLRVGIVIEGLLTAVTAYVPSAFLERSI